MTIIFTRDNIPSEADIIKAKHSPSLTRHLLVRREKFLNESQIIKHNGVKTTPEDLAKRYLV